MPSRPTARSPYLTTEPLESRTLFAAAPAHVLTALLDNRGTATLTFSAPLQAATLTPASASLFSAGKDKKLATADDVRLKTTVVYAKNTLTLSATGVKANQPYRLLLDASKIKDTTGKALDGEFKGAAKPSGNGQAGGNYDVVTTPPATIAYRYTVRAGSTTSYINVNLFSNTPLTTANFRSYADQGAWDNTFFHRSTLDSTSGIQVIQGGGFTVNSNATIGAIIPHTGVGLELTHSNLKGTLAMARTSDPNANTNQWFFNVNDNADLDTFGGGYTVFGAVADPASQKTIETINALPIRQGDPLNPNSPFNQLPTIDPTGPINVPNDLVLITRVAQVMGIAKGK